MLRPEAESLPLEEVLAHYRAHGWARLGPVLAPEALLALQRRAEALMLGEVVHPGLYFQADSPTGRYDDIPRGQGWVGPSLHYRKLEKLERDPLFAAWIANPWGRSICTPRRIGFGARNSGRPDKLKCRPAIRKKNNSGPPSPCSTACWTSSNAASTPVWKASGAVTAETGRWRSGWAWMSRQ